MAMKKPLFMFILLLPVFYTWAQDSVSLDDCYRLALKHYPFDRQQELLDLSSSYKIQSLNKNYLPQVNVNGSASLQSEVTKFSLSLPAGMPPIQMPELSRDMYKLTLDVNQVIYDGGITLRQKQTEEVSRQIDRKNVESEILKVKDRIDQLYFSILLLRANHTLLDKAKERIQSKLDEVESGVRNGIALQSNADVLKAELIRTGQQITESESDETVALEMLSEMTGTPITSNMILLLPKIKDPSTAYDDQRPEFQSMTLQQNRINTLKRSITSRFYPKLYGFGQAGIGRPGFNMLSNDLRPLWIFGAKLSWNLWNWNQNKTDKKSLDAQRDFLGTQKEAFEINLRVANLKDAAEITKLESLIEQDKNVIALREKITLSASSQLDNGVITSSDYISRLNEEIQARLLMETHNIQVVKARLAALATLGKR